MTKNNKATLMLCIYIIYITLFLTASLMSCSQEPDSASVDTQDNTAEILPYKISITKDNADELRGDYNNILLMYPTVSYPDESGKADKINEMIRDIAVSVFNTFGVDSDDAESYSYVTETAMIMLKKENFFSAVMTGYYTTDTAAHREYFSYSINCDIENERLLTSEDIIKDFIKIRGLFISGKFTLSYGMDDLLEETTYADIFTQYKADYSIYPDVYFTSSSFGVVTEIVYHLGGNACFEIPYSEVISYLNADIAAISEIYKNTDNKK